MPYLHVTKLRDRNYQNAIKIGCSTYRSPHQIKSGPASFIHDPDIRFYTVNNALEAKNELRQLIISLYPDSPIDHTVQHKLYHKFDIEYELALDLAGQISGRGFINVPGPEDDMDIDDDFQERKYNRRDNDDYEEEYLDEDDFLSEESEDEKGCEIKILRTRINSDTGRSESLIQGSLQDNVDDETIQGYLDQGYEIRWTRRLSDGTNRVDWADSWIDNEYLDLD